MRRNISHTPKAYSLALDSKINQFRSSIKNKTPEIDKKYDLKIKVESFRVLHYENVYKFTAIDQLMDILHRLRFKIFQIKYSESLSTARKDIDDAARRKAEIDVKVARLRDDLAEYRNR